MYDEQTRINAAISYLFLWPIFLLARKETPLAHPYVQLHAKKSSFIIALGFLSLCIYSFLEPLLTFALFWILVSVLFLASIFTIFVGTLLFFAYRAYNTEVSQIWETLSSVDFQIIELQTMTETTEAEKIRVALSFIPLLSIWISGKYHSPSILLWKKISTFFFLLMIGSSFLLWPKTGWSLLVILFSIIVIISTGVSIVVMGRIPYIHFLYRYIPSYETFLLYSRTWIDWIKTVIKVLSGYEEVENFSTLLQKNRTNSPGFLGFIKGLPLSCKGIWIPFLNLIYIPFLLSKNYHEHRGNILQGIFLTILFIIIWWFYGFHTSLHLILFIPMIHLITFAENERDTHAPVVDIVLLYKYFRPSNTEIWK